MKQWILKIGVAAVLAVSVVGAAGCQAESTPKGETKRVEAVVLNDKWEPGSVSVARGGTVTFINKDAIRYSVTIEGLVDKVLEPGESYTHTFEKEGTYVSRDRMQSTVPAITINVK